MNDTQVLIVGAGPTGLVLALWLTALGVSVRIIDKADRPGTTSRALAVHARTLELYEQLDLAQAVMQQGYSVPGARMWFEGHCAAQVPFAQIASDLTPYSFLHIFPQDEHETLLVGRLKSRGVQVERSTELMAFASQPTGVIAQLRGPDGAQQSVQCDYIAGCDGARSKVRETMGLSFPGGTYPHVFFVADIEGSGPAFNGDLNLDLNQSDFLAVFPLAHQGRVRLIGTMKAREGQHLDALGFGDISGRATEELKLTVTRVNWFSVYHVHHRVTDRFRKERCFLLGDAAHIHSPVGGQGMNTGIGDAINLAWKLRAVLAGCAGDALLDSYEAERRAFAVRLVETTDRFFNLAVAEGPLAELVRTRVAPLVLPNIVRFEAAREYIFRTLSQLTLNYRGKGLDAGTAGPVHGGDRLPWTTVEHGDNYGSMKSMRWQVHVYGKASDELLSWCARVNVPLHEFPWANAMEKSGLRRDALYLIRPDTYIAVAQAMQDTGALDAYFTRYGITP